MKIFENLKTVVGKRKIASLALVLSFVVPCLAAAPFVLKAGFDPLDPVVTWPSAGPSVQSQEEKEKREKEIRQSEEREREMKGASLEERRNFEREMRAKQRVELSKASKITMERAIQIASAQTAGTVLECRLVSERNIVFYHVVILTDDNLSGTATHHWIGATDGQVIKTEKEDL